jgi:hypothetical protein
MIRLGSDIRVVVDIMTRIGRNNKELWIGIYAVRKIISDSKK